MHCKCCAKLITESRHKMASTHLLVQKVGQWVCGLMRD